MGLRKRVGISDVFEQTNRTPARRRRQGSATLTKDCDEDDENRWNGVRHVDNVFGSQPVVSLVFDLIDKVTSELPLVELQACFENGGSKD